MRGQSLGFQFRILNIKVLIDGGEEVGSPRLAQILDSKRNELASDYLLVVDCGLHDLNTPAIVLGTRGEVSLSVEIRGANTDLHSGSHGGVAKNPVQILNRALGSLHDSEGRVMVPGFYDAVYEIDPETRAKLKLDFDEVSYKQKFGVPPVGGERKYAPLESAWLRPTLEIAGVEGGFVGEEVKTIIPSVARAAISCRLVPEQDPDAISKAVVAYLEQQVDSDVAFESKISAGSGRAFRASSDSKLLDVLSESLALVFGGSKPVCVLEGLSISIIAKLKTVSGGEALLFGMGLDDDRVHAPLFLCEQFCCEEREESTNQVNYH